MKTLLAMPLLLLLAACETTSFQAPPVAAAPCDADLVGNWSNIGDKPEDHGEVELRIDAGCRVLLVEHEQGATRTASKAMLERGVTDPSAHATTLHVGSDGRARYLWVDARWAEERLEGKTPPPEGDVYVMRYRVRGDRLRLEMPDSKAVAHRIIDGKIKGEIQRGGDELHNRVLAPVSAEPLRARGFWDADALDFRKAAAGDG